MKNEKCQKMGFAECSARKDSPVRNHSFPCCLVLLRAGLDLDWLLQLDLLLDQLLVLGRLAEEGLAPGVGPAAEVGLPAAEVGLPREAGSLAGLLSS